MSSCRAALMLLPALLAAPAAAETSAFPVTVTARPIAEFQIGRTERQFGPLEFVGGLELAGSSRQFGALSAFRFLHSGSRFLGVTDTGFWFSGQIARDGAGAPTGLSDVSLQPIQDEDGRQAARKWEVDAEGLAVTGTEAIVGFERNHRIVAFALHPGAMGRPERRLPPLVPLKELRQNRGFETVAVAPAEGPLRGAVVIVSEKSLDKQGNIFAAVLSGPRKGVFTVTRGDPFDITDGDFLPNGDLLLLERSFSMADGVAMRLRRIPGGEIRPGAVADGDVLVQADMAFQIDNMEALDVWRRDDGATMVSLMSDDNHSIFQRTVYLEFILHED